MGKQFLTARSCILGHARLVLIFRLVGGELAYSHSETGHCLAL